MPDLTPNQHRAMKALIKSCLSNIGGSTLADLEVDPFVWVEVDDLIAAGWSPKEAQGTFASLLVAGLVYDVECLVLREFFCDVYALTNDWDLLSDFHP
jgi:hypothetical protein